MKPRVPTLQSMNSKPILAINYKLEDFVLDDSFVNFATKKNQADITKWEKWFSQNPKNSDIALDAKTLISQLRFKKQELTDDFVNDEWLKLSIRLHLNEIRKPGRNRPVFLKKTRLWAAAASIIMLFSLAIYYFTKAPKNDKNIAFQELIVKKGEVKNILLEDGTVVFINSDSKFKYGENFGGKRREVFLEGEAWFDVSPNADMPFVVHTQDNDITVLGTAFNIYAYPNENTFRASLEHGKISISHSNNEKVELKENQSYLFFKNSKETKICDTENAQSYSSWKEGKTVFRNQSFTEILKNLERSHNVTFSLLNEKAANIKFTGNFSTKDDIITILEVMKLPMAFEYEIVNDTIIIK